jgi:hypothetical protein
MDALAGNSEQPVGQQIEPGGIVRRLKGMQVVIGQGAARRITPVDKLCALPETRAALPDQTRLIDTDPVQDLADGRGASLTDSLNATVRRFDQGDAHAAGKLFTQNLGKIACGNPTGRTAANDQNMPDHCKFSLKRCVFLLKIAAPATPALLKKSAGAISKTACPKPAAGQCVFRHAIAAMLDR